MMVWYTSAGAEPTGSDCAGSTSQAIVGGDDGSFQYLYITRKDVNEVCGGNRDGTYDHVSIPYAGSGTTSHIAIVHTGGNISVYHNGALINTIASGNTESVATAVHVCDGRGLPLEGIVHHVAFFNVAVPASEIMIQGLSKRPRLRRTAATADWLFDNCADSASGDGVVFRDLSGSARTITGNNGADNINLTCKGHRILSFGPGVQ